MLNENYLFTYSVPDTVLGRKGTLCHNLVGKTDNKMNKINI